MRRIWAIARNTITQGIRMKVALVLILFLLVVVPALPFLLKTDGTQPGQVRIVLTYSLTLAGGLLSILTLFLSTATLCSEFKGKQIYLLDPKPVPRWQILAGKWLGVMVLNAALLLLMGGGAYALIRYLARPLPGREREYAELRANLLVARRSQKPEPPDVSKEAAAEYEKRKKAKTLPTQKTEAWIRDELRQMLQRRANTVRHRQIHWWQFKGLPKLDREGLLVTIRFKHHTVSMPERAELRGVWSVGVNPERAKANPGIGGKLYEFPRSDRIRSFHQFSVPADCIPEDGILDVGYRNVKWSRIGRAYVHRMGETQPAAQFPGDDGIEVLYPAGGIAANFARGLFVILMRLALLAAVGLFAASFCTFPVAALLALTIYGLGLSVGFIAEVMKEVNVIGESLGVPPPGTPEHWINLYMRQSVVGIVKFLAPDFSHYNPVPFLEEGRMITWGLVGQAFGLLLLIRGGIVAAFGCLIFHFREVAGLSN